MNQNFGYHFNPEHYEDHLSPFGKRVLQVMVRQWQTGCNQNGKKHKEISPNKNKRVLSFYNSHATQSTVAQQVKIARENRNNMEFLKNALSEVPKSEEIIQTVHTVTGNYVGNDDVAYPDVSMRRDLVHNVYDTIYDADEPSDYNKEREYNMNKHEDNNIDWDDMFDSALLPVDSVNLEIKSYLKNEEPVEYESHYSNVENNTSKNPKRKKQTKMTDVIPKTVKKTNKNDKLCKQTQVKNITDETKELDPNKIFSAPDDKTTKNSFRKQKYTKTVKNWLNDVSPNNPVEGEAIDNENKYSTATHKELKGVNKQNKDGKKTANPKKVIQSQLANKDGVMKYSKPKQQTEINKSANDSKIENCVIKEKKVKTFIAPIKSQIPVKDILFKVFIVRASDIDEFNLLEVKKNDIFVTQIYSNGFSQLNCHHTDDTCVPDGIILNNGDIFYSFETNHSRVKEILKHLFENNKIICYDGKSILIYLATQYHIEINSSHIYDAQIGCSLLDPDNPPKNFTDLQKLLGFTPQYTVSTECRLQKAAWYLSLLSGCWAKLSHQLVRDSLWGVFLDIETPLLPIIANMERRGVKVDVEKLRCMEQVLAGALRQAELACHAAAGRPFQVLSATHLRDILYHELRLQDKCNVTIRETLCKGAKSTSEAMLRSLRAQHPLPGQVLQYRRLHKAHATFLAGIAHHLTHDGLIRPTWVQMAAATGRMACNNPNLQAIPKTPFSLEGNDLEQVNFRSIYIARPGHVLLAADFKHVECRVFAHAAADAGLLDVLRTKDDLFRVLAGKWLKKGKAEVSSEDRERTKRIVYASLYGAGARKLMDILNVSYEQALAVTASFNRTFPSLKSFGCGVVGRCSRGAGRLATAAGRARRLPAIASGDSARRAQAERQAVNFIIQGTAADLCKTAMVRAVAELRARAPPPAHLLLQLHDELVWEVDERQLETAAAVIQRAMQECWRAEGEEGEEGVEGRQLPVALSVGRSWGHMTPLILP